MPQVLEILVPELSTLCKEAFKLFRVSRPSDLAVCTFCCMTPQAERRALDAGQSNIALADLREWHDAAFDGVNGQHAVRWILPRSLEFLAAGYGLKAAGDEVCLQRLELTGFPDGYHRNEVALLENYAVEYVTVLVEAPNALRSPMGLDDCLCMFALGGFALQPILERLDECSTGGLIGSLVKDKFVNEIGFTGFWKHGESLDRVMEWYGSEALEARIVEFWSDENNPIDEREAAELLIEDISCRR